MFLSSFLFTHLFIWRMPNFFFQVYCKLWSLIQIHNYVAYTHKHGHNLDTTYFHVNNSKTHINGSFGFILYVSYMYLPWHEFMVEVSQRQIQKLFNMPKIIFSIIICVSNMTTIAYKLISYHISTYIFSRIWISCWTVVLLQSSTVMLTYIFSIICLSTAGLWPRSTWCI